MTAVKWLEVHIDTNHTGLEPVETMLSALGIDGVVIDDETEFEDFLENNRQYWDYVDEDLRQEMQGRSRITFYLEAGDEGFAKLGEVRIALEELKKTGFASFIIAMIGVIVPLLGGMGCYLVFDNNPSDQMNMIKAAFIGVVLTATSVSITVETLREMGKLKSRVGTAILGAAVIDDILGIIVLTILSALTDPSVRPLFVLTRIVAFFVFVAVVGLIMYKAFLKMEQKWHKHRRIAIYAVAFALLMSYVAERFFGIADITGAYFAGIVLCSLADVRDYVASKTNVLGYMLFSPLFFASIGIKTNLEGLTVQMFGFAVVLTIIAILTKIIGCLSLIHI